MAALVTMLWVTANRIAAADLIAHDVAVPRPVSDGVIVGRAECGGTVWLLNEDHQLAGVVTNTRHIAIRQVHGLKADDRPWGLACVQGELWTLADPRVLARIGADGRVEERVTFPVPRIALFGAGDRLLYEQIPPVAGAALFSSSPPRKPRDVRRWPGLLARPAVEPGRLLTDNLVSCGLTHEGAIPCWFPDETNVTISNGSRVERRAFPFLRGPGAATAVPIHDVAVRDRGRVWLMATARERIRGRLVGGSLALASLDGREIGRLSLNRPARMILAATDTTCLLLTASGGLLEINER